MSNLKINIGESVGGKIKPVFLDLDKTFSIVVGGCSGSGKSTCLNNIITQLIYNNTPEELQLILCDPKYCELKPYENMPHLHGGEIMTDNYEILNALVFVQQEIRNRYIKMRDAGVKHIDELKGKQKKIVLIIDELANIMLSDDRKNFEERLINILQWCRAAGIKIILATQSPTHKILTGLIRANVTGRIIFRTTTQTDSRILAGRNGAELLTLGEAIFQSQELYDARLHTPLITTQHVNKVINNILKENK